MIVLENIDVTFAARHQKVQAVDDVSIRVSEGEVFGIVGSSGAGKSTLLRVINLLQVPTRGRVSFEGRDITGLRGRDLRQVRAGMGMIFQHFNLMHTRTVADNVAFPLQAAGKGRDEIRQRVPEILELVGLSDKAKAFPSQLSGGQKQRVGIARALANRPHVLLCDEPTSALDLETSASILELLKDINAKLGITIVLISHEMHVIKQICTRVAVMDQGRVVEEGDVFSVFSAPTHPFTKALVDRTFNLELPDRILAHGEGVLVKILFLGEGAERPILSEVGQRYGVSVNVLHGKIEYLRDRALGLLVARLTENPGAPGGLEAALAYLKDHTARVEVL